MLLSVREYGIVRRSSSSQQHSLDIVCLDASTFDGICSQLHTVEEARDNAVLSHGRDRHGEFLKVGSHVGIIQTNDVQLEILPKITASSEDIVTARRVLLKMITCSFGIKPSRFSEALLSSHRTSLPETLLSYFLSCVDGLLRDGFLRGYASLKVIDPVYRGKVLFNEQVRMPPGRRPEYVKSIDHWSPNLPENRAIKAALQRVSGVSASLRAHASRILDQFDEIPDSLNPLADLSLWHSKQSRFYEITRSYCRLILMSHSASLQTGPLKLSSLLFPMPHLFERYVERKLKTTHGWLIKSQVQDKHLARRGSQSVFPLRPDLIASNSRGKLILDTKWKLPISDGTRLKRVSPPDIYQALAYSEAYAPGGNRPSVVLVYPRTGSFHDYRGPFVFPSGAKLFMVPFDLLTDRLTKSLDELEALAPAAGLDPRTVDLT